MKYAMIAILLGVGPGTPIDAAKAGFPDLLDGGRVTGGKTCNARRAIRAEDVKGAWRGRIARVTMTCEPFVGINGEPDSSTDAIAAVKPGVAALDGVPVVEIRRSSSWANGDDQFVLVGRYARIRAALVKSAQARCRARFGENMRRGETWCAVRADPIHGGLFIKTGELGGTWVHPDPKNPARTIYAEAWSE